MARFLMLVVVAVLALQFAVFSAQRGSTSAPVTERPLILEQNRGEVRVRRLRPGQAASWSNTVNMIKVDARNGGSRDMMIFSEALPPGITIKTHRHLHQDEFLYIGSGKAHVHVGNLEGDAHAGAIVFIPRNTWVSVKNVGDAPIALVYGFNGTGYDKYIRCETVPKGQPAPPISTQEWKKCVALGDVEFQQ